MAGFLYYVPGCEPSHISRTLLEGRGIDNAFRDIFGRWQPPHNITLAPINRGPDGKHGCYIYPIPETGNLPRTHGYDSSTQEWEDQGDYWLGTDTEQMPNPAELVRPVVVSGYEYRLGDDCEWICPVIRRPDCSPNVPQSWSENGNGFTEKILTEWEWAWNLSKQIWNVFLGTEDCEKKTAWNICCQLLSINYRLGKCEISKLQLVNSENYVKIFQAAIDGEMWIHALEMESDEKKSGESVRITVNS